MSKIRLSYEETDVIAKDFAKQREAVLAVIQAMAKDGQFLLDNWNGVSEQEFMRQLGSCVTRMNKTPALLLHMSNALTKTGTRLDVGEKAAKTMMQNTITAD